MDLERRAPDLELDLAPPLTRTMALAARLQTMDARDEEPNSMCLNLEDLAGRTPDLEHRAPDLELDSAPLSTRTMALAAKLPILVAKSKSFQKLRK